MKRLAVIAALLTAMALPSLALAADGPPPGKYTAKIAAPAALKGTWTLSFAKNGTYTISLNGKIVVRGHDLSIAPQIQFYKETGSKACKSLGFYNFKRSGKTLTFDQLNDKGCAGRSLVLSHRFTFVK
jgi:hypothetical protein